MTDVITHAADAEREGLADLRIVPLGAQALTAWEALNDPPAQELPGLAALFRRPSPFVESIAG